MEIYKKLLQVQKEVGAISKDSKNPFFKSKYFDINSLIQHVEPILTKHGLLLMQPIKDGMQGSVIVDIEDGSEVYSFLRLPDLSDPQKLGSAVTYYRRYTLCSLLALQAEDDDANAASKASKQKEPLKDDRFYTALTALSEGKTTKEAILKYALTEDQKNLLNKA